MSSCFYATLGRSARLTIRCEIFSRSAYSQLQCLYRRQRLGPIGNRSDAQVADRPRSGLGLDMASPPTLVQFEFPPVIIMIVAGRDAGGGVIAYLAHDPAHGDSICRLFGSHYDCACYPP